MSRRPQDSALAVKFVRRSVLNEAKSWGAKILDNENRVVEEIKGAGHPVHDNVDYVEITIIGDRANINFRPVMACDKAFLATDAELKNLTPPGACRARTGADEKPMLEECDVHRFHDEWLAFKSGHEKQTEGIDLSAWPGVDPASLEDLAYFKVRTVEQLAAMSDSNVGRFHAMRDRARQYLEALKKGAPTLQMRAELDEKDAQLKALTERLAALEGAAKPATKKEAR